MQTNPVMLDTNTASEELLNFAAYAETLDAGQLVVDLYHLDEYSANIDLQVRGDLIDELRQELDMVTEACYELSFEQQEEVLRSTIKTLKKRGNV